MKILNRYKLKWASMTESERNIVIGKLVVLSIIFLPITIAAVHWLFFKHIGLYATKTAAGHAGIIANTNPPYVPHYSPFDPSSIAVGGKVKAAHHAAKAHSAAKAIHATQIPWNTVFTTSGQL
jgi:hypothetical protein